MDFKICGLVAAGAFILSFLVGLISPAGFFFVVIRALASGAFFFAFVALAQLLISRFLPELFGGDSSAEEDVAVREESDMHTGRRVDVSVGDDTDELRGAGEQENPFGQSILNERKAGAGGASSGMDQRDEGGYTESRAGESAGAGGFQDDARQPVPARPPELIGDVDVLPDLESMSDSFVSSIVDEVQAGGGAERPSTNRPRVGDDTEEFDPREMASAIQTILKRDQKG